MSRGELFTPDYRPQFSGHETFPLRYGWLKKAFDAVKSQPLDDEGKAVFKSDEAIALFGVGKNMVDSIRHWAIATGIVEDTEKQNGLAPSQIGELLFGSPGVDPYLEHPSSLWLIHWNLAARPTKTTWHWVYNYFPNVTFDRDHLVKGLQGLAEKREWSRVATSTIRRDVECFIRTYSSRFDANRLASEDSLESPLIELGLIRPTGKRDGFRLARGPKTNLYPGIFAYALQQFWPTYTSQDTLSFEALAYEPGSPARVFLLDENDLMDHIHQVEDITGGRISWSETAGLRQLIRTKEISEKDQLKLLRTDFQNPRALRVA